MYARAFCMIQTVFSNADLSLGLLVGLNTST